MSAVEEFFTTVKHYPYGLARVRQLALECKGERTTLLVRSMQAMADWEARALRRARYSASTERLEGEDYEAWAERIAGDMLAWLRTKAVA